MNVKEIIESIRYFKPKFQKESIIEARKNKEAVCEELLKELTKIDENLDEYVKNDDYFLHVYAVFLLAEFKEKRAFKILTSILSKGSDIVDKFIGQAIFDSLDQILASVYDGNVEALYNIIKNSKINEYVRSSAFGALEILESCGVLTQEQIVGEFENFIKEDLDLKYYDTLSILVSEIVRYISSKKIYEKIGFVRKLYNMGLVDSFIIGGYDTFIDDIYSDKVLEVKTTIDDCIESMSWWYCFNKDKDSNEGVDLDKMFKGLSQIMTSNQGNRKIGRNEPCPCR